MRWLNPGAAVGLTHRLADTTALAGLGAALAALLAVGSVLVVEPILVSMQGPDPCGYEGLGRNGVDKSTFMACVSAHRGYYQYDPVTDSVSTPQSRISRTLEPVAGLAAPPLALGGVLISWLALAMGTGRRRIAFSALALSGLLVAGMVFVVLGLALGGGD